MLQRKGAEPYEYMNEKEEFYVNLNIEDITDAGYMHTKIVWKDFEIKKICEYHDLYLKSDTLLLADVFRNFKKMCVKIYHLDSAKFLSALKKTDVTSELLTNIDMLLMVEKGIIGG